MPRTIAHTVDTRSTKKRQKDFLNALEDTASVRRAAKVSKVPRRTVYDWLEKDKKFKVDFDRSKIIAADALEDEAVRRAHEGVLKPVYQGGKKVGQIREYSDSLLIQLMKGCMPEKYKDRFAGELSGQGGGPIKTHHTNDDIDWGKVPTEMLQVLYNARKPSDG
jgi:terminase small subunit-like protein